MQGLKQRCLANNDDEVLVAALCRSSTNGKVNYSRYPSNKIKFQIFKLDNFLIIKFVLKLHQILELKYKAFLLKYGSLTRKFRVNEPILHYPLHIWANKASAEQRYSGLF